MPGGSDNEDGDLGDRPPEDTRVGDLGGVAKGVLATTLVVLFGTNEANTIVELANRHLDGSEMLGFGEIVIVGGVGAVRDVDGKRESLTSAEPSGGVCRKTQAIFTTTGRREGEASRFGERAFVKIKLFRIGDFQVDADFGCTVYMNTIGRSCLDRCC